MTMRQTEFSVHGMSCGKCVGKVTEALQAVPGVESADVSLAEKRATVVFDDRQTTHETLTAAVVAAGFQIPPAESSTTLQFSLPVHGMSCQKCVAKVTAALADLPGVEEVQVSLPEKQATVTADPLHVSRSLLEETIVAAGFHAAPSADGDRDASPAPPEDGGKRRRITLKLGGMTCANCAGTIEKGVNKLDGVFEATVNFAAEKLTAEVDPERVTEESLIGRIEELGYRARPDSVVGSGDGRLRFGIRGMHCSACARTIETKLEGLAGVRSVAINVAEDSGTVEFDPVRLGREEIFDAVVEAGYQPYQAGEGESDLGEATRQRLWLIFSAAVTAPIMPLMWWQPFGGSTPLVILILASLVQFTAGLTFYRGAWNSLKNRSSNMDVLVALGISAAYFYSLFAFLGLFGLTGPVFFETGAMLITFIRFGKWLEARAKGKAGQAARRSTGSRNARSRAR